MNYLDEFKYEYKKTFVPGLKKMEFTIKGNYYLKPESDYFFTVNLQKSQYNNLSQVSFYLNVGINIYDYNTTLKLPITDKYACYDRFNKRIEHYIQKPLNGKYTVGNNSEPVKTDENTYTVEQFEPLNTKTVFETALANINEVYMEYFCNKSANEVLLATFIDSAMVNTYHFLILDSIKKNDIAKSKSLFTEFEARILINLETCRPEHKASSIEFYNYQKKKIQDDMNHSIV